MSTNTYNITRNDKANTYQGVFMPFLHASCAHVILYLVHDLEGGAFSFTHRQSFLRCHDAYT